MTERIVVAPAVERAIRELAKPTEAQLQEVLQGWLRVFDFLGLRTEDAQLAEFTATMKMRVTAFKRFAEAATQAQREQLEQRDREWSEAHIFLTGRFEMGWVMAHPDGVPETELGQAAKRLNEQRDELQRQLAQVTQERDELLREVTGCRNGSSRRAE